MRWEAALFEAALIDGVCDLLAGRLCRVHRVCGILPDAANGVAAGSERREGDEDGADDRKGLYCHGQVPSR